MPKRKIVKKTANKTTTKKTFQNFFSRFKLGDSYISLFLGLAIVVVIALIGVAFIKANKDNAGKEVSSTSTVSTDTQEKNLNLSEKYTVKTGDDLWSISERIYGSGYNWVDIARVNKIENPETIHAGMQLDIPDAPSIVPQISPQAITTQAEGAILEDSYVVVEGDNLWNIAVRAYGDGYKWVDLAKENKLNNPDLIFPDNKLKISR